MINQVLQLNNSQLANTFNSHLEKHFNLVLPSQPNSLNPLKIERGNPLPKRLLVSCKKNLVLPIDRGNPIERKTNTSCKIPIDRGNPKERKEEMDQLAREDHTYNATRAEINVYRGNWWIHSNVANFDSVPTRYQPDFKKALSTMHRLKQAEDEKKHATW